MNLELLHFYNENEESEYIVLAEPARSHEHIEDAKSDGYKLQSRIEFEGDIDLPINRILST